jgi:hypothetical protein
MLGVNDKDWNVFVMITLKVAIGETTVYILFSNVAMMPRFLH